MPDRRVVSSGTEADGRPFVEIGLLPGSGFDPDGRPYLTVGEGDVGTGADGRYYVDLPFVRIIKVPTDPGLILAGAQGRVKIRHRLYRSNLAGEELEELSGKVSGGTLTLSNFRDWTWEVTFPATVLDVDDPFDVFGTYARLVSELYDPFSKSWLRFPLGVYVLGPPKGERERERSTFEVSGRSLEAVLAEDGLHASGGYSAPAGVGVLAEVRRLCGTLGFPLSRLNFPPASEDVALTTPLEIDAAQDSAGCYYLRICNRLLAAGGFIALYADKEGRLATKKSSARARREPDVFYGSSEIRERLVVGAIGEDYEDNRFGNRIVVRSSDALDVEPIRVAVENRDPNSPASIKNFGRVVQPEPLVYENLSSAAEALALARGRLAVASGLNAKLNLRTVQDPRLDARQTYSLSVSDDRGREAAFGTWFPVGATLPLDEGAGVMEHQLARSEEAVGEVA